jgi:hypothetical protein
VGDIAHHPPLFLVAIERGSHGVEGARLRQLRATGGSTRTARSPDSMRRAAAVAVRPAR